MACTPPRYCSATAAARRWTPPRSPTSCCGCPGSPTTFPRSPNSTSTRSSPGPDGAQAVDARIRIAPAHPQDPFLRRLRSPTTVERRLTRCPSARARSLPASWSESMGLPSSPEAAMKRGTAAGGPAGPGRQLTAPPNLTGSPPSATVGPPVVFLVAAPIAAVFTGHWAYRWSTSSSRISGLWREVTASPPQKAPVAQPGSFDAQRVGVSLLGRRLPGERARDWASWRPRECQSGSRVRTLAGQVRPVGLAAARPADARGARGDGGHGQRSSSSRPVWPPSHRACQWLLDRRRLAGRGG